MTTVRVEAPARLHLGMLDASGEGERRFGGLGVAVTAPAVIVHATASGGGLDVDGPDAERAARVAERVRESLGAGEIGARLRVLEAIPPHVGLGSGTKLALAVAAALWGLAGRTPEPVELARLAGRGARSAVGLWTFALGGLVVEGGRRRDSEEPAPLLVRHAMPDDWWCVIAVPAAERGLSGGAEAAAFAELRPEPARSAEIAQVVLTALLPGLVERDLPAFGAALTRLQRLVGDAFAPVQGGTFHRRAEPVVEAMQRLGAAGAGQSSWGPAVYGVVGREAEAMVLARRLEAELGGGLWARAVRFDNRGARVAVSP